MERLTYPLGVLVGRLESMRVASGWLLIAFVVFGVIAMHSVAPVPGEQHAMPVAAEPAHPVAHSEHDCPSGHAMMHPCAGTVKSWPASPVLAVTPSIDVRPVASAGLSGQAGWYLGRAPPWSLQGLDESVTLRV